MANKAVPAELWQFLEQMVELKVKDALTANDCKEQIDVSVEMCFNSGSSGVQSQAAASAAPSARGGKWKAKAPNAPDRKSPWRPTCKGPSGVQSQAPTAAAAPSARRGKGKATKRSRAEIAAASNVQEATPSTVGSLREKNRCVDIHNELVLDRIYSIVLDY